MLDIERFGGHMTIRLFACCALVLACAHSAPGQPQLTIPAEVVWVDTGIMVRAGQVISIVATGRWSNGGGQPQYVGPDGFGSFRMAGTLLPSASLASLIGKIDSKVFFVGSNFSAQSSASGELYLGMNDLPNTFGDNRGSLRVSVELSEGPPLVNYAGQPSQPSQPSPTPQPSPPTGEQSALCKSKNVRAAMQNIENQQARSPLALLAPALVCGITGVCEEDDGNPGPRYPTVIASRPATDGGGYTRDSPGSFVCQALVARAKVTLNGGEDLQSTLTSAAMNNLLSRLPTFEESFKVVPAGGGRFTLMLINTLTGIRMPDYSASFAYP